jgi:hypothetical protein
MKDQVWSENSLSIYDLLSYCSTCEHINPEPFQILHHTVLYVVSVSYILMFPADEISRTLTIVDTTGRLKM